MRFRLSGRDDPDGAIEAFRPHHHQNAQPEAVSGSPLQVDVEPQEW